MAFDTATSGAGPVEVHPTEAARRQSASIGGRTVAWMEQAGPSNTHQNIVAHDLDTGETEFLTTDGATTWNQDPAVSPDGNVISWTKCLSTGLSCDVYTARRAQDGTWGGPISLIDGSSEDFQPDTNGTVVAYVSAPSGDYTDHDVWWKNVDGTVGGQLTLPGIQLNPSLAGNLVAFESEDENSPSSDLFVYDLTTERLYQVTHTADVDERLNDISVSPDGTVRMVWAQPDGLALGTFDVYAITFKIESDAPAYEICPLFDRSRSYRLRSTVPIKLQLCDEQGENLSSPSIVVTATGLVKMDGSASTAVADDAGNASPDSNFRFDPDLGGTGGYIYNLSTKGLSTGTWELRFLVSGDPATYSVTFDLR